MNNSDPKEKPLPNEPERRVPVKPDENPDPSKKPEENDPTRIREPKKPDPTRIDEPPPEPTKPPVQGRQLNKNTK